MKTYLDKCPCKDCQLRTIDCHGKNKCKRTDYTYEQWVASGKTEPKNNWISDAIAKLKVQNIHKRGRK